MFTNLLKFESIVEGKVGHFFLENGATIQSAKEMCLHFLKILGQLEDSAKEQAATAPVTPVTETPVEVTPEVTTPPTE